MSETSDEKTLAEAVDALADRFRAMPQSRLLGAVAGHSSRAAAGLALARWLAVTARAAEAVGADGGSEAGSDGVPAHELPDAGAFAVGDQLAVVGHDLAAALAALPGDAAVALPDGPVAAEAVRALAVRRLAEVSAAL
ncbi:hypothetical protein [Kitasatospora purpeofusca]|uniref:hypothetical protein n=1 Tax=Kitasatospora purpeofusca TaxID=67352 RepID=UPI002A5AA42B|nr:hypothetical protein [Kitasatospora purpeofusca]MDY0815682.1 hypothetical protein [Kitasatospora purpeofusca]